MRDAWTTPPLAAALTLALTGTPAQAWHGHRHWGHHRYLTIGRASPEVPTGYRCPLGQYWRPSLGICQGEPYGGGRAAYPVEPEVRREPPARVAAPQQTLPPIQSASSARRIVDTDTKVVGRSRRVTRNGVMVTYEVRTKVTERYPNR